MSGEISQACKNKFHKNVKSEKLDLLPVKNKMVNARDQGQGHREQGKADQ